MGTYPINGIKVKFPFKPYPSQIGMMDRVIRALDGNKQHALLESPTGSGKTMALLCGVLSWMEEQKKKHNLENQGPTTLIPEGASPDVVDESENLPSFFDKKIKKEIFVVEDETDLDFVDSKKSLKSDCSNCPNSNSNLKSKSFEDESNKSFEGHEKFEMPKVYFASRTHKQLAQSIRELKRSGYQTKFTVLASRGQYCVNSQVKNQPDINEAWYILLI
jgi:fanconi anemia group J protein